MDFIANRVEDGRRFRPLTALEPPARESLADVPGISSTGERVLSCPENLRKMHGMPRSIQVDNGSEFYSKAMDGWAEVALRRGDEN